MMTDEEYQQHLNSLKFKRICFAADYIEKIMGLQGFVQIEDYSEIFSRLYSEAFKDGQNDVFEEFISYGVCRLHESNDADTD